MCGRGYLWHAQLVLLMASGLALVFLSVPNWRLAQQLRHTSPTPARLHVISTPHRRRLTIWIGDCHSGTTADILGMSISHGWNAVYASNTDLSNADWLTGEARKQLIMAKSSKPLAPMLQGLPHQKYPSNVESNQRDLFNYYRNDSVMMKVDAFICTFPAVLCEALFSFNKTVIFAPAHRFSLRRCSKAAWENTIQIFKRAAKSTSPRHYVAALSRYDAEYINYFTGLQALPLYSSSRTYTPKKDYKPTRTEILIGPLNLPRIMVWHLGNPVSQAAVFAASKFKFATARELYRRFKLEQLLTHKAAVILPYATMSYGMTELYAMGVPLFLPSVKWMKERPMYFPEDRTMTGTVMYCGPKSHDIVPNKDPSSKHPYSPESLDEDAKYYWLKFADFYQWPHVQFFDSIVDLDQKLSTLNLTEIHRLMMVANERRAKDLDVPWQTISAGIDQVPREVPNQFFPADHYLPKL